MNFQWILLAIFTSAIVLGIAGAITRPMLKNVLRFLCVPVAFIFTYILLLCGIFQSIVNSIVVFLDLAKVLPGFDEVISFVVALVSTWLTPLMFTVVFMILIFLFRTVHVNLIYHYITRRQMRREKAELKARIKREKAMAKAEVRENEKRIREYIKLNADRDVKDIIYDVYETPDNDDIEDMVEERVEKEYKAKKKRGIFKENAEHKAISVVAGAVSGFLILAVFLMPTFHFMSNMSAITEAMNTTDADDTKMYHAIELVDKHIVTPYEESFVFELYDSIGLVDLMNDVVRRGGKIVQDDGNVVYIDTMSKNILASSVRLALEITSGKSEHENVANDITAITSEPVMVSMMASGMVVLMQRVENPVPEEGDIMGAMLYNILDVYKTADKQLFIEDMSSITDTIVVIAEKNLLSSILTGSFNAESLLQDPAFLGDVAGAMSGLSVFPVTMDSTFNMVIDMIAPMMGTPADNAAGYDSFMNGIVTATGNVADMTDEDLAKLAAFMEGASKFDNLYDYVVDPVERTGGLRDLKENGERLKEYAEELKNEAEVLKLKGEDLKADGEKLKTDGEALKAQADALQAEFDDFTNNPPLNMTPEEFSAKQEEMQAEIDRLTKEGEELQARAEQLEAEAHELEADANELKTRGEKLAEDAEDLTEMLQQLTTELQNKMEAFAPFINYYMSWNYVQKPFMVAGEDSSTACLSIKVGNKVYVCNTDCIDLQDILDAAKNSDTNVDINISHDDITNGNVDIDALLEQIPMKDLLQSISVDADLTGYEGRISPAADLVNHIINSVITAKNNGTFSSSVDWVRATLESFDNGNSASSSAKLAAKLLAVNSDEEKKEFDYLGTTVADWHDATHFSPDEWSKENRKEDGKKLVDIIFTMMDMMESMGGGSALPIDDAAGDGSDTASGAVGDDSLEPLFNLLTALGKTMDIMSETHCLGELPPVMIESLLKNEMLSIAMTPSMFHDFMNKLEPEREDFTYEAYMQELVSTFSELLDNLQEGAAEQ